MIQLHLGRGHLRFHDGYLFSLYWKVTTFGLRMTTGSVTEFSVHVDWPLLLNPVRCVLRELSIWIVIRKKTTGPMHEHHETMTLKYLQWSQQVSLMAGTMYSSTPMCSCMDLVSSLVASLMCGFDTRQRLCCWKQLHTSLLEVDSVTFWRNAVFFDVGAWNATKDVVNGHMILLLQFLRAD